jgi:PAS domain S-box-containing protein
MNLALRDLLKITDEEIIGKYNVLKDSQVKEQGFLPLVTSVFEKGKTVNFTMDYDTGKEKQIKLGQKTCKMLNFVISPIKDPTGKVVNVICQHNDITEKEEAVKMLKAREEQYKLLIDNLPVAVAVTSIDGKFLSFNDAMLKMSSYTREELLNTPVMNLYCNPEERKKILQKLQKKEPIKDYEIEFRSRDGRIFHARVNMAPLKMGKEEVILTVVEDINKEKKANTGSVPGNPATG